MSKINIFGSACVDILVSHIDKDSFFSGTFKADHIETRFGGDALNETYVLHHFRQDVKLISLLGDDLYGNLIYNDLKNKRIRTNEDILRNDMETSVSIVLIQEDGERILVGNKEGSVRQLKLSDIMIDEDCKILVFASMFSSPYLYDYNLNPFYKEIKERNILTFMDTSSPKNNEKVRDLTFLKYIDYFFCNEEEAIQLCDETDLHQIEEIFYHAGARNVIIKCGKNGCYYRNQYYPADRNIFCVDSTGAGDSFVAGFIIGINSGLSTAQSLKIANQFGGNACSHIGAVSWLNTI